ncbi:LmbE family N-acetylglucosaminyl deacetylase [Salirhabdus euzebyi]|uniref:LmbE family N-acetylglucosaminyl deacetylase n=1 Tax=Salirhabdus euzebyi TaxID=394506 RepID=A0A841Q4L9_9BACI|nr:PIG-L deacetylase family protein [Salirhabdus euzebyi]MBB6453290.1 LmbE family N-acetylglucosaminyl deacetylase [Salirhabdus euzebyi]
MNVLVIATHADDEVLGVGGTLALHARNGDHITVCTVAEADPERKSETYLVEKRKDTLKAHEILGVDNSIFLGYHATKLDTIMHRELIADLEKVVEKVDPDMVYTHYWGDVNKEHRVVTEAMQVVLRPKGKRNKIKVLSYEVLSSTEWGIFLADEIFKPNSFVDITTTLEIKKKALEAYKTEEHAFPHPRSIEAIDASAKKWGSVVGMMAAEPFIVVRETMQI